MSSDAVAYRVSSVSDKGPVREQNEDNMVHFDSPYGHVVIVADGMGGHGHGDLAAALVVNGFQEALSREGAPDVVEAIRLSCAGVNAKIIETAKEVNKAVMGSTVVMVVLQQNQFYVAHVGDSRAYLIRDGKLTRITKDHSVVQREVDDGLLTEEQAREDSRSSILTKALGTPEGDKIEVQGPMPVVDGDGILLCTDGLHGFVLDRQIEDAVLRNNQDPQKVTKGLVNLAIGTYFSNDNVTVQFIQIGKAKPTVRPVFGKPKPAPLPAEESAANGALANGAEPAVNGAPKSLLSKLLFWLGFIFVLAIVVWAGVHYSDKIRNAVMPPTGPAPKSDEQAAKTDAASTPTAASGTAATATPAPQAKASPPPPCKPNSRVGILFTKDAKETLTQLDSIKKWKNALKSKDICLQFELVFPDDQVIKKVGSESKLAVNNEKNPAYPVGPDGFVKSETGEEFGAAGKDLDAVVVVAAKKK